MNDCLSPEVLEALSNGQYEGLEMFEILEHLEKCEKCRSGIKPPTKEEILKRFEDDEPPPVSTKSNPKKSRLKKLIKRLFSKDKDQKITIFMPWFLLSDLFFNLSIHLLL